MSEPTSLDAFRQRHAAVGSFVCTWCGHRASARDALEEHYVAQPYCRNNRLVTSPLNNDRRNIPPEEMMCACGHMGDAHANGDDCARCACVVFSLAGWRTPDGG